MTLVVTHTEGFLGCFTVEPDGSMKQRALIDTGHDQPTPHELAHLGMNLAEEYGWALNGVKAEPVKKALPAQKKKQLPPSRVNRTYPPRDVKEAMILDYLRQHGSSSLLDFLAGVGQPVDSKAKGNWYHIFRALSDAGTITSVKAPRKPGEYAPSYIYSLGDLQS